MRLDAALKYGRERLTDVSDAPHLDAQWILLHVLGRRETSWTLAHGEEVLTPDQLRRFKVLVRERRKGRPLAYLLRESEFYGRRFYVDERVLIPRPSTEALVEAALIRITALAAEYTPAKRLVVADLGTGSGCIAITLLLEVPHLIERVVATDISADALAVAEQNALRHQVADKIEFVRGHLLEPLDSHSIDVIVSNPPYVPRHELTQAAEHALTLGLLFEPRLALDGGTDGTDFTAPLQQQNTPLCLETAGGEVYCS